MAKPTVVHLASGDLSPGGMSLATARCGAVRARSTLALTYEAAKSTGRLCKSCAKVWLALKPLRELAREARAHGLRESGPGVCKHDRPYNGTCSACDEELAAERENRPLEEGDL